MNRVMLLLLTGAFTLAASADEKLDDVSRKYRETLKEASPGELYVIMGEELYRKPRGPKNVSLERCDFGLGPGVLKGAYAQLPRYFPDTNKVQDLESRLMSCMRELQGFGDDAFPRHARGDPRMGDFDRLAAYIASQSNGIKLAAPLAHPKEQEAYRIGEYLFYRRAGVMDFSCATCHTLGKTRVRLQPLVQLMDPKEAQNSFPSWPAYRVGPGEVDTLQDWLAICYWAARHPQLGYGSETAVALQVFLARHASGGVISAPSVKR